MFHPLRSVGESPRSRRRSGPLRRLRTASGVAMVSRSSTGHLVADGGRRRRGGQEDQARLHVRRLEEPPLAAVDRERAERPAGRLQRAGGQRRRPLPPRRRGGGRLEADAVRGAAGDDHDPAGARARPGRGSRRARPGGRGGRRGRSRSSADRRRRPARAGCRRGPGPGRVRRARPARRRGARTWSARQVREPERARARRRAAARARRTASA